MATINPFQGPINYSVDVQSPFEAALGGFKIGAAGAEIQAQQQKRDLEIKAAQQAQEKAQNYQTGIDAFFAKPAEQRNYSDLEPLLVGANKQQFDALQAVAKGMNEKTLDSSKRFTGQLLVALEQNPETAKTLLNQRIEAETDPQQKLGWQDTLKTIDLSPKKAAETIELLGAATFGKDWYESITKVRDERRTAEKAPATLAELEAKALEAGVSAEFARPLALANLAKIKAETLAPAVRESIDYENLKPNQQKTFQALQILKKPPAAVTNVNVSNVDKTAAQELGKLVPDLYNQANSAALQLSDLPRYQAALDSAITGPFAEQRLSTARVASALGFTGDKAVNATREVIQGLSEMALKSRTMLTGQGQITEGEQKLLIKARSGDIDFTKGELKTIFGVADRAAKAQYNQSRKLLESAAKQSPTAQMFLENMQPLATQTVPAQAAPAPPAAIPSMPAGFRVIR
jgi:hypothetical protein